MKKIRIAIVLLICLLVGSSIYVRFLKNTVNTMNTAVSEAYGNIEYAYDDIPKHLAHIENELKKHEGILCTFIDQKLISDIKNELLVTKELYTQRDKNGLKISLIRLYEKIDSLKDTEEFNLKKIL